MFNYITKELQKEAQQHISKIDLILKEIIKMNDKLDNLTAQVSEVTAPMKVQPPSEKQKDKKSVEAIVAPKHDS